jgi:hypothetical protein
MELPDFYLEEDQTEADSHCCGRLFGPDHPDLTFTLIAPALKAFAPAKNQHFAGLGGNLCPSRYSQFISRSQPIRSLFGPADLSIQSVARISDP